MADKLNIATTGDIGALVKKRRGELSLSQSDLAKKIGASRRWVSDIEGGKETSEIGRVILTLRTLGMKLSIAPMRRDDQLDHCDAKAVSLDPSMLPEVSIPSSANIDALNAAEMLAHRYQLGGVNDASGILSKSLKNDVLQAINNVRILDLPENMRSIRDSMSRLDQHIGIELSSRLNENMQLVGSLGLPENIKSITDSMSHLNNYIGIELSSRLNENVQLVGSLGLPENIKSITDSMSHLNNYIETVLSKPLSKPFPLEREIEQSVNPVSNSDEKLQSVTPTREVWPDKSSNDE
ncbi:hypothetical protein LHT11_07640 [Acetobacter indonesiensis]|uniref:hypothetical protein n=1 Tax=Acetobacter indonesiensis TaxID=104101 RepID=UPI001F37C251|nr:hypothetical protein [Acetobacter indonesiensis]MCG0995071.1 hypothetical protein [Acetobacter indonesiensis]